MRKYTWKQVAENKDKGWLVIDGVIFNPTPYLNQHPGGSAVLQNCFGKDATRDFKKIGHRQEAYCRLDKLEVGLVDQKSLQEPWQAAGGKLTNAQNFNIFFFGIILVYIL